jgi:hypothetical protein
MQFVEAGEPVASRYDLSALDHGSQKNDHFGPAIHTSAVKNFGGVCLHATITHMTSINALEAPRTRLWTAIVLTAVVVALNVFLATA